jgi:methylated-DNA-[protein]-cysteine S-methyltransferase
MQITNLSSPFGDMTLAWEMADPAPVVHRVFLSRGIVSSSEETLATYPTAVTAHHPTIALLIEQLQGALAGETHTFELGLIALDTCNAFQRRVLLAEYAIPRGSISTYGRIAAHLGVRGGARAVGNALSHNPFPLIIPCHRAVRANATLGGYQGGSAMKRALLEYEGHTISAGGQILNPRFHY